MLRCRGTDISNLQLSDIMSLIMTSGIGIDDMFVIVQCLNNVKRSNSDQPRSVSQVISETMRHAGVSITVTSVTDILAFGVGYFTVSRL